MTKLAAQSPVRHLTHLSKQTKGQFDKWDLDLNKKPGVIKYRPLPYVQTASQFTLLHWHDTSRRYRICSQKNKILPLYSDQALHGARFSHNNLKQNPAKPAKLCKSLETVEGQSSPDAKFKAH